MSDSETTSLHKRDAVLFILLLLAGGCGPRQYPDRFLIPAGYVGWVHVQYGIQGAPPLPVEHGFRLLRVPATGRLKTCAKQEFGWASNEFYYVSGKKWQRLKSTARPRDGSMVWDRSTSSRGGGNPGTTDVSCFIGTEAQFDRLGGNPNARLPG
jgi:hypothetical protein